MLLNRTNTIAKGVPASQGVGFIKRSYADAALEQTADVIDMAL